VASSDSQTAWWGETESIAALFEVGEVYVHDDSLGLDVDITRVEYVEVNMESISFWVIDPDDACVRVELPFLDLVKVSFKTDLPVVVLEFSEEVSVGDGRNSNQNTPTKTPSPLFTPTY